MESFKTLVHSKSGLRMVSSKDSLKTAFELDEPTWARDEDFIFCPSCQAKFDFLNRRHHCRRCGLVFCSRCTSEKVSNTRMSFVDPVRMCKPCSLATRRENDFFTKHLKALTAGCALYVFIGVNGNEAPSFDATTTRENSDLTFFPSGEPEQEVSEAGKEWRRLHCRICPSHRFLVLSEEAGEERIEVTRLDLIHLDLCLLDRRGGEVDVVRKSSSSIPESPVTPTTPVSSPAGTPLSVGSSDSFASSFQPSVEFGPAADHRMTITFKVPILGYTSDHYDEKVVVILPLPSDSRESRQNQLRWMFAFQKAARFIIAT